MHRSILALAVFVLIVTSAPGHGRAQLGPEVQMLAAKRGRVWGIATYRIGRSGYGTYQTTKRAEAFDAGGLLLGTCVVVRVFSGQPDSTLGVIKLFLAKETIELVWASKRVTLSTNQESGTFELTFDGVPVGTVAPGDAGSALEPRVRAFMVQHGDLLKIASDIKADLDAYFPDSRVLIAPRPDRRPWDE